MHTVNVSRSFASRALCASCLQASRSCAMFQPSVTAAWSESHISCLRTCAPARVPAGLRARLRPCSLACLRARLPAFFSEA
eukprot:577798-Pleurochrysis_carterae.AAC.1